MASPRKRSGILKRCPVCSREFYVYPCLILKAKYCSKKCQHQSKEYRALVGKANAGRSIPDEVRTKISRAIKSLWKPPYSEEQLKTWYLGQGWSLRDIAMVVEKDNSAVWKWLRKYNIPLRSASFWHGARPKTRRGCSNKYGYGFTPTLKSNVRYRDKEICQECFMSTSGLVIHHIDYNKQNHSSENLISLCPSCHAKTNYNRGYWEERYGGKIWAGKEN